MFKFGWMGIMVKVMSWDTGSKERNKIKKVEKGMSWQCRFWRRKQNKGAQIPAVHLKTLEGFKANLAHKGLH